MISQSRIDAGWNCPWYIAEASWHGSGSHANQEGVVAGQRLAVHGDPLTFLGETTDDMHLTGSGLHFDAPHLLKRAQQYTEILTGTPTVTPVNGHFEDNRTPAVTGLNPLADGVLGSPNGGEVFTGGQFVTTVWGSRPGAASYRLHLSLDSGATWKEVARLGAMTSYKWIEPFYDAGSMECSIPRCI